MSTSDILERLLVSLSRECVLKLQMATLQKDVERRKQLADKAIEELLGDLGYAKVIEAWKAAKDANDS